MFYWHSRCPLNTCDGCSVFMQQRLSPHNTLAFTNMPRLTLQEWKDVASLAQAFATGLSLFVAASWVYYRYVRNAENRSNVGMKCEIKHVGILQNTHVVQVTAVIENRGKVPYTIHALELKLRAIHEGTVPILKRGSTGRNHLDFGEPEYVGSFIGENWRTVVDPGIVSNLHQVVSIPTTARLLHAFVSLRAPGSGIDAFNAEQVFLLPEVGGEGKVPPAPAAHSEG